MLLWKDIKDMKWAVILITAYFALGWKYLYSLCPVVVITGFPCPGCGLTRAGVRLLRLDFAGAFGIQPFIYPIAWEAEDGEISEGISDYVNDRDDHILCLEDDELFPRGISNELLS